MSSTSIKSETYTFYENEQKWLCSIVNENGMYVFRTGRTQDDARHSAEYINTIKKSIEYLSIDFNEVEYRCKQKFETLYDNDGKIFWKCRLTWTNGEDNHFTEGISYKKKESEGYCVNKMVHYFMTKLRDENYANKENSCVYMLKNIVREEVNILEEKYTVSFNDKNKINSKLWECNVKFKAFSLEYTLTGTGTTKYNAVKDCYINISNFIELDNEYLFNYDEDKLYFDNHNENKELNDRKENKEVNEEKEKKGDEIEEGWSMLS